MAVVDELLRTEEDGTISFGNHKLAEISIRLRPIRN